MIKGLRSAIYPLHVPDLQAAKAWYTEVLGQAPYFDQPFYVGFNVGGFELGLWPEGEPGTAGCRVYWGVEGIEDEVARIQQLGGQLQGKIEDVGEGIRMADLRDPYGNLLGLIENPLFDAHAVR
ncbi:MULTISPECIES: VOC family protein [unclassified Massilia]|uniref:VOC family protein n=1 Tax=unclassified Massilia TaxID=2609279 RepID=UPI001594BBFE|nr:MULTISPECIES: VOC family protein [unclassified Massilia]NVD99899.1 VOC family protein [Massilia sp. BJB1822]UTY57590.1 VOC family protein [Massilia sp. erpn]